MAQLNSFALFFGAVYPTESVVRNTAPTYGDPINVLNGLFICPGGGGGGTSPIYNSPAELIRWSIVDDGLGSNPGDGSAWPVFVGHMPDEPDNAICVYDTAGTPDGRVQRGGETIEHPGWQVRVRSVDHPTGWPKITNIRNHLDSVNRQGVVIDTYSYTIQAVTLTGGIQSLGQEPDGTRRNNYTINGIITTS